MKKLKIISLIIIFIQIFNIHAYAMPKPQITAKSAILVDVATGKILYAKNENQKAYPTSLTKVLTALVAMDYLVPDEIITIGSEITNVPYDLSKEGLVEGENITVLNLLRGLLIPSGNEPSCVIAMEVAKRANSGEALSFNKAEQLFSKLMNKKAKDLGALGSNFVNPHGYHNNNHYTTANDFSLIVIEALKNETIKQIVKETQFIGLGVGEDADILLDQKEHKWFTNNLLLSNPEFSYKYATGVKTGISGDGGYCLAASAQNEEKSYVAIILNSVDPDRWEDAVSLFEYGFENFNIESFLVKDTEMGEIKVHDPRLGEDGIIKYATVDDASGFYSKEELDRIKYTIAIDPKLIYEEENGEENTEEGVSIEGNDEASSGEILLKTPIEVGQDIGTITYELDGETIYTGNLVSLSAAAERTFNSDVDYYVLDIKNKVLSINAIPYWIAAVALLVLFIYIIIKVKANKRRNRNRLYKRY